MSAFTIDQCLIRGLSTETASSFLSGQYAVEYTVSVTIAAYTGLNQDGGLYVGPRTILYACQTLNPYPGKWQPVPKRWQNYDYRAGSFLGGATTAGGAMQAIETEYDAGSYCKDWIVRPVPESRFVWRITALFSPLAAGEIPNIDVLGKEITNPINWYPRYKYQKFHVSEVLDFGWNRDAIASSHGGVDYDGNVYETAVKTPIFGPFSRDDVVTDLAASGITDATNYPLGYQFLCQHPLDTSGVNKRKFKALDSTTVTPKPATSANLTSPQNYPKIVREYGILLVRMNFQNIETFRDYDDAMKDTVWNGGDDWEANSTTATATMSNKPYGRLFFGCRWGTARYQGGSIVGDPIVEGPLDYLAIGIPSVGSPLPARGYYIGEFRFELWRIRECNLRIRNEDWFDIDGLPIYSGNDSDGNPITPNSPQWLDLDGTWLGNKSYDANWVRFWYGRGYDYAQVTNGGVTTDGAGGELPIQIGMFKGTGATSGTAGVMAGITSSDNYYDYHFPPAFPYPARFRQHY